MTTVNGSKSGMATSPRTDFQTALKRKETDLVNLSWRNVNFVAKALKPGEEVKPFWRNREKFDKQILRDVSGSASSGQFVAIMGPSGAGKTSLINILAGRCMKHTQLSGELEMNGSPYNARSIKKVSGYVLQDDLLLPYLTVRDCLTFSALLRLPMTLSKEQKLDRVESVLAELNLLKCANTQIGNEFLRGVSGGERKRTAIGVELVTDPSVLFLDEPTTGLDSHTALEMVKTLKALAQAGRTVICTIHQPNSAMFQQFDILMLMARGEVAYFGVASRATEYFSSLGYQAPNLSNPADYLLDVLSDDHRSEDARKESDLRVSSLLKAYQQSHLAKISSFDTNSEKNSESSDSTKKKTSSLSSWWNQVCVLTLRAARNSYHDKMTIGSRVFKNIVIGVVFGLIYLRMGHNQKSIGDRVGILFFLLLGQAMGAMLPALTVLTFVVTTVVPQEKKVVNRERRAGMYQVSAYYLSKWAVEFPMQVGFPIVFGTIVYFLIGLQPVFSKYVLYQVVNILEAMCAEAMGIVVSVIVPDSNTAMSIGRIIQVVFMLFGGLYQNLGTIPPYFVWIAYVSHTRWGLQALAINEFTGLKFYCKPGEFTRNGTCPFTSGKQVLHSFHFDDQSLTVCILALVGIIIVYRFFGYVLLRIRRD